MSSVLLSGLLCGQKSWCGSDSWLSSLQNGRETAGQENKKKGAVNKEGEPGGERRARARERVRWEMERKKKGKRLITERCKVTPWLIDLDQLPATWIKLASYSQQTFLLLSKLKYVMYALVITVPNLGINTLFHYEFTWLSQNLTEFNQINFWRCRSEHCLIWYFTCNLNFLIITGLEFKRRRIFFTHLSQTARQLIA